MQNHITIDYSCLYLLNGMLILRSLRNYQSNMSKEDSQEDKIEEDPNNTQEEADDE